MLEATIFIAAVIAGATEAIKSLLPGKVYGLVTVLVALAVGVVVSFIDTSMGVVDVSAAEGIMIALSAIGVVGAVKKIG